MKKLLVYGFFCNLYLSYSYNYSIPTTTHSYNYTIPTTTQFLLLLNSFSYSIPIPTPTQFLLLINSYYYSIPTPTQSLLFFSFLSFVHPSSPTRLLLFLLILTYSFPPSLTPTLPAPTPPHASLILLPSTPSLSQYLLNSKIPSFFPY